MADSLRDQLIAAGYQAPKKEDKRKGSAGGKNKHRKKNAQNNNKGNNKGNNQSNSRTGKNQSAKAQPAKNHGKPGSGRGNQKNRSNAADTTAADAAAIEERKKLKAKIKTLIDETKLEEWKGEVAYRYLVDKRIRELYVKDTVQEKLADRTLAITRLNGDTYVIPRETALAIREINPQWSVFNLEAESQATADETEEYADFKVPDDLKW